MANKKLIISILLVIILAAAVAFYTGEKREKGKLGAAPGGMSAVVASSTYKVAIGAGSVATVFSANRDCASRVISTAETPIMLYFATSSSTALHANPSAVFGHWQAASTTVNYDGGTYGCPEVRAYAPSATTISVAEFKGWR